MAKENGRPHNVASKDHAIKRFAGPIFFYPVQYLNFDHSAMGSMSV